MEASDARASGPAATILKEILLGHCAIAIEGTYSPDRSRPMAARVRIGTLGGCEGRQMAARVTPARESEDWNV